MTKSPKTVQVKEKKPRKPRSEKKWEDSMMYYCILCELKKEADNNVPPDKSYKGITVSTLSKRLESYTNLNIGDGYNHRDSVQKHLTDLMKFGKLTGLYTIIEHIEEKVKDKNNIKVYTYYKYKGTLDPAMLRLIFESVSRIKGIQINEYSLISKFISGYHNEALTSKIDHKTGILANSYNPAELHENLKRLYYAIDENISVTIRYGDYGPDKRLHPRKGKSGKEKLYVIYPIRILVSLGRCYVLCRHKNFDNLSYLRVDRIIDVIPNVNSTAQDNIRLLETNSALKHYANRLYVYAGDMISVELETDKKHINDIIDWFGSSVNFIKIGENKYSVTVKATEQAIIFWALQYSQYITVKKPENIIDKIKSALETALEKYSQQ